jgi:PAP2 superfamily
MTATSVDAARVAPAETLLERLWRGHQLMWVWGVGVVVLIAIIGIPTSRPAIFAIVGFGLLASCAGSAAAWKRVVLDWAPLFAILTAYDILRGLASRWLTPHALDQIRIDQWMFGGTVPTVSLQHWFYTPGVAHVWDYAAFVVYLTHFGLAFVVAAWLWKTAYPRFRRFAALFVALSFAGFFTYAIYPAMPPWLASREAILQPTSKIIDEMWSHIGLANGSHVLSATGGFANPIAAVPSLHAAYPMLILLFFWKSAPRWRGVLVAYTLAMALTLIYTGEHYVIDIFLGWTYAAAVYFGVSALLDRRHRSPVPATVPAMVPATVDA